MRTPALLPALMVEPLERVFGVGFGTGTGTGTTVGEFASLESTQEITVAEFSPGVVRAAPPFDFANRGVSTSPKMQIVASDAYRSLAGAPLEKARGEAALRGCCWRSGQCGR